MQFKELYRSVKNAARYVSKDESRGALCGVRIEPTDDSIVVTATNGHVLYSEEHQCEHGLDAAFTLDAKTFLATTKVVSKSGFKLDWSGCPRLVDGYPDWRRGVPTVFVGSVGITAGALSDLTVQCKAVGGAALAKTGLVRLSVSSKGAFFSAVNKHARVTATGEIVPCGVDISCPSYVGFNYKYLGWALQDMWGHFAWSALTGKKAQTLSGIDLEWGFNTDVSASVLQGGWCHGRRLTVLVMPLRIYD